MKKRLLILSMLFCFNVHSQSNTWSVKFSNAILSRYTPTINALTFKGWEYSNGIVLHGIEKVYNNTRDSNYLKYIKAYVDSYMDASGNFTAGALTTTLDKIQPGVLCLFLYKETGLLKYKNAATNLKNYLLSNAFQKTPDGGYWHKNDGNYNNVMMLDGIYMAEPFMARYGYMFNDTVCTNTAVFQTLLLASHVYDNPSHLLKHAWDYYKIKPWANTTTGASGEVWSRGMGWYAMALVDILKYTPTGHPKFNQLRSLLDSVAIGIKNNQDPVTGLWYQVVNKKDSVANYTESSGSGMFIYALKTAVDNEWIDTSYLSVARKGWQGLQTKIAAYTDGLPQIKSFAPAMGVQNNYTVYVTAPYTAVNCPTAFGTQHPHGYCGLLMAASAMEFPVNTYIFTGDGNWSNAANWLNNTIPPNPLPAANGIIIDPVSGGKCRLNLSQQIAPGSVITIKKGKVLEIPLNFSLQ